MNWKRNFFILLGIVVLIVAVFSYNIGKMTETSPASPVIEETPVGDEIKVTLGREAITTIINRMMVEEKMPITAKLDDKIHFLYRAELLGRSVDIRMTGRPTVTNGGNWEIVLEEFSAGTIHLPEEVFFALLEGEVQDNPILYVKGEKSALGINFSALQLGGTLRAKEINLGEDELVFSYYLPEEHTK